MDKKRLLSDLGTLWRGLDEEALLIHEGPRRGTKMTLLSMKGHEEKLSQKQRAAKNPLSGRAEQIGLKMAVDLTV